MNIVYNLPFDNPSKSPLPKRQSPTPTMIQVFSIFFDHKMQTTNQTRTDHSLCKPESEMHKVEFIFIVIMILINR